jgi:hypothetical protein
MIPNLSFTVGSITLTPFFWSLVVAVIISSFSIWRRLKEDYPEEVIFSSTLAAALSAFLCSRLLFVLLHLDQFGFSLINWLALPVGENFSLTGAFLGVISMGYWRNWRLKQNPWEFLDALTLPLLYFLTAGGLGAFLTEGQFWSLAYLSLGFLGLLTYPWFKKRYRSFAWYQSGKMGFLISFYSFWIFASLILLAFLKNGRIYSNELVSLGLVLLSLGTLYYRSERDLRKDSKILLGGKR